MAAKKVDSHGDGRWRALQPREQTGREGLWAGRTGSCMRVDQRRGQDRTAGWLVVARSVQDGMWWCGLDAATGRREAPMRRRVDCKTRPVPAVTPSDDEMTRRSSRPPRRLGRVRGLWSDAETQAAITTTAAAARLAGRGKGAGCMVHGAWGGCMSPFWPGARECVVAVDSRAAGRLVLGDRLRSSDTPGAAPCGGRGVGVRRTCRPRGGRGPH